MHPKLPPGCSRAAALLSPLQALRRFGQFRRIRLDPPLPVDQLVLAALEAQEVLGRWQVRHMHGLGRLPTSAAAKKLPSYLNITGGVGAPPPIDSGVACRVVQLPLPAPAPAPAAPSSALQDSAEAGTKVEVAALLLQLLRQKAALLEEHFGIAINDGE